MTHTRISLSEYKRRAANVTEGDSLQGVMNLVAKKATGYDRPWEELPIPTVVKLTTKAFEVLRRRRVKPGKSLLHWTEQSNLRQMVDHLDSQAEGFADPVLQAQWRELCRLIADVAPEMVPLRDALDQRLRERGMDPLATVAS